MLKVLHFAQNEGWTLRLDFLTILDTYFLHNISSAFVGIHICLSKMFKERNKFYEENCKRVIKCMLKCFGWWRSNIEITWNPVTCSPLKYVKTQIWWQDKAQTKSSRQDLEENMKDL